jgi:sugar phosphate isomerase/epimerase
MPPKNLTRREAIKTVALGAFALPLLDARALAAGASAPDGRERGLRLGVATYSTRNISLDATITTLSALRIHNAGVYKAHLPWETATPAEARAIADKFHAAGITLSGTGVVNLPNDETACRKAFENAKAAALATMVCKPEFVALPLIEKLAKEYDQKLAIHNHGPEDKLYPTPADVWKAVSSLDSRIGLCIDVGHSMRARTDPIAAIKQYASRLYDLHLKDSLAGPGAMKNIPTEIGTGTMNIRGILRALLDIKYNGVVAFEYEREAANPVTGLAESIGYVRGMLATMT